ncbi:MAG: damage-inducible protein DinB [Betaproteobacteria bacterium]|nr:damage-inducible protein DinB [Betaproteobacteria bacterium]
MTTTSARMLTRYNRWANEVFFKAVAELPAEEITKPRQTLFKNIVHTLNHNYVIDCIFRAHLEGREHGYTARNTVEPPSLDELRRSQRDVDAWYVDWSDAVTDAALDEKISFTFVGGGAGVMTREQILMHLVNHTSYHRGFAADLFYQIPAKPPTTDLTVFLRDVPQE